jgi:hypothetical protein
MMRTALALLLAFCSLDTFAAKIERLSPASIEANSGEHFLTIYGSELAGPVLYSSRAGEFSVDISSGGGTSVYVWVPLEVMTEPGDVKVTIGDASAILRITAPPAGPLQVQGGDPVAVAAEGRWGAHVKYEVHVIGGKDPNPTLTCDPPSGSIFPLGPSYVRCVATNSYGERAEGGKYIFVADYGAPFVKVPDRIRVEATSPAGAYVEFTATAEDTIDGELPVSCDPKSGSLFAVGETIVQCVATDSSLNQGHGEFVVEVVAGPKEELLLRLPPDIQAEATGADGAEVEFEVTAYGTSDPNPEVECEPKSGSVFPIGSTVVKCVARDSLGNSAEGSFNVTVSDTVGPIFVGIVASPEQLVPNMKWTDVKIEVEVVDIVDPMPRCRVTGITTNQPGGGAEITGELSVSLLADRDPQLGDRHYNIRVECLDESQNASEGFAVVQVPKGNGDDGPDDSSPSKTEKQWKGMRRAR